MKDERLFTRDFTMVIIGQIISLFGNAVLRFALPLYLLREMDSSVLFGTISACSFIPMVIFSLFGGIIADRVNKRNIMVTLDFCTAALIIFFGLSLGKLPLVSLITATLMILYGISGAYQPSVQYQMIFGKAIHLSETKSRCLSRSCCCWLCSIWCCLRQWWWVFP